MQNTTAVLTARTPGLPGVFLLTICLLGVCLFADVQLAQAQTLESQHRDVKVVVLERPFETLSIRRLAGGVDNSSIAVNVKIKGLEGMLEKRSDTLFLKVDADMQDSGDPGIVQLECKDGIRVVVAAEYGTIDAGGWHGMLEAEIAEGTVQLSGVQGEFDISGEFVDVIMSNVDKSTVNVNTDYGTIVHCKTPLRAGAYNLQSKHGDVQLFHYESASYSINASSVEGMIDAYVKGINTNYDAKRGATVSTGSYGMGAAAVNLNSTDGFITIALDVAPTVNLQLPMHGQMQSPAGRGAYFQAPHFFGCPCHAAPAIVPSLEN